MSEPRFEVQNGTPERATCRGCSTVIFWVRTVAGKAMCLDRWQPMVEDGRAFVLSADTHWSSCPERQRFVKPKKATLL